MTEDQRGQQRAVIVDNGISKAAAGKTQITRADQMVGTRDYMPPLTYGVPAKRGEHFGKVDIFGLGLIMLECLTGKNQLRDIAKEEEPWKAYMRGETTLDVSGVANTALRAIIARMVSPKPEENFSSAMEVIATLRGLGQQRSGSSTGSSDTLPTPPPVDTFKATLDSYFAGNLPADRQAAIAAISARIPSISQDKDLFTLALDALELLQVQDK
jgi:serine/threonine protein kinase